ncbi:hypothetical protein C3942_14700 [Solimonas fluminis]|uniref:Lipoprotein SmpA/OmlA domain-containing protein n=1 Tax=Solimonas fluminis TaxID=2086571 RepID=A0A2S5TDK8_9GAMM|nr:hypothetical protein [Solimonas fluminis]PPE73071.1 hypothetical protein C3942_14700 [Solimonas fluminis]
MQATGINVWAVMVLCAIFLGIGLLIGVNIKGNNAGHTQPTVTRDEFAAPLIGKTYEEVLSIAGRPDATTTVSGTDYWRYMGRTYNPITGKAETARVVFEGIRVSDVLFSD